ncbi:MAG: hypothetical protein IPG43_14370 [Proteobacteria bacterium]|nr:hypothetical protein [Pseudomonadota bacterium]
MIKFISCVSMVALLLAGCADDHTSTHQAGGHEAETHEGGEHGTAMRTAAVSR